MEKLNLCQKLVEIRKCVPYLKKDTKGYNYTYVSGSSILTQIQDKMNELGVLLVPSVTGKNLHIDHYESTNSYGKTSTKEVRIVEADMVMTWIDAESGDKLEVPWLCFGEQDDVSKAFGSGLTYSERYFLLKFFNAPTDDDDPDSRQQKPETKRPAATKPVAPQNGPQPPEEDVPDFPPPNTVADTEKQLITALKKKLGAKMKGMEPEEMKALYAWMIQDKKETVDVLQNFIDKYQDFATNYEFSQKGAD